MGYDEFGNILTSLLSGTFGAALVGVATAHANLNDWMWSCVTDGAGTRASQNARPWALICKAFRVKSVCVTYAHLGLPRVREARPWALICNPFGVKSLPDPLRFSAAKHQTPNTKPSPLPIVTLSPRSTSGSWPSSRRRSRSPRPLARRSASGPSAGRYRVQFVPA